MGFNRRHSEAVRTTIATLPKDGGPLVANYRVSAGRLPEAHWYKDRRQGGRLLGEVCHFVDVTSWIVGSTPVRIIAMGGGVGETLLQEDLVVTASYADGSMATVTYAENGHGSTPKERLEILGRGHSVLIDDYKRLTIDGKDVKLAIADKGHVRNLELFRDVVTGEADGSADLKMSIETSATMLAAAESLTTGTVQAVIRHASF